MMIMQKNFLKWQGLDSVISRHIQRTIDNGIGRKCLGYSNLSLFTKALRSLLEDLERISGQATSRCCRWKTATAPANCFIDFITR